MRSILFLFTMFFACACQTSNTRENVGAHQLVEGLFSTFNNHDSLSLAKFYTKNAQVISPETCEPTIGRAAIAANYQALFNEIPDVHDELKTVVIDNNMIAVTFVASSHVEGQSFELPIAAFMTLENGLISKDEVFFDTEAPAECA